MSIKSFFGIALRATLFVLLITAVSVARGAVVPPGFTDSTVVTGLTNPTTMAFAPDGRLFVCQQAGLVRVIKDGALLSAPFVSVPANANNDRGLLGIAFDPGFSSNNFVYLSYTAPVASTFLQRVSRFTANGDVAVAGSETNLLETDSFSVDREVGGAIRFGRDGMLYVGMGQSGNNAQITNSLFGKILRINKDGTIPSDNPFFNLNTGKNRAVWALGIRNPFTFAFQNGTGRLFINDVGSGGGNAREEINQGMAGGNYGWQTCEGNCNPANPNLRNPLAQYTHTNGVCAIVGAAFYNPPVPLFPTQYVGKYFFSDLCGGWIKMLDPVTTNVTDFGGGLYSPVAFEVGPDGALYYLQRGGQGGASAPGAGTVGKITRALAVPFISVRSLWKYLDTGTNLGTAWRDMTFSDASWASGLAQLGYGEGDEARTVGFGTNSNKHITTYFRQSFSVPDASVFTNLVLRLLRDDGGVIYLNSNEVFRSNLPAGTISNATLAPVATPDDGTVFFSTNVPAGLLVSGTNVLAVEIHQNSGNNNSDLSFDLDLTGFLAPPKINALGEANGVTLSWPGWATNYTLQAASTLSPPDWATATNAITLSDGQLRATFDTSSTQQFIRLIAPVP